MNAKERETVSIAIERLQALIGSDPNSLIPADGVLEWLRGFHEA